MDDTPRYKSEEIDEINAFLQESYIHATAHLSFAKRTNPSKAVEPEVERLKKKKARHKEGKELVNDDLAELTEALASPYAKEAAQLKEVVFQEMEKSISNFPPSLRNTKQSIAFIVLHSFTKKICKPNPTKLKGRFVISSASLILVMQHLEIPPVFAPVIIWLATNMRDFGVPVFCESVAAYLKQVGIE